jgi:hypothetical protein
MRKRIASGLRACASVLKADSELSMQAYCTDVPTPFQKLGHPQEQPYQTFAASEDIYIRWTSIIYHKTITNASRCVWSVY